MKSNLDPGTKRERRYDRYRNVRLFGGCLLAACLYAFSAQAQYYDQGRSPASIRWKQSPIVSERIIYPDYYQQGAARVAAYLDTIRPYITYGFTHEPLKIPVILHTQNMMANGLVLWAPKRIEMRTIPDQKLYAMPWLKQLSVHEYRHAVQYGNLYQGFMKPLGWFIGEQSGLISSALVPIWMLEGDATMAETQFSSFGRALQPSFTLEYRAYLTEGTPRKFRRDKWFCGSYRDFIPDHYQLGYQLTAWSRERYGDDIWDRVIQYASKRPYTLATTRIALGKYYKTSSSRIFDQTFEDLRAFWLSLPQTPNSSTLIETPTTSYTTYSAPMPLNDTTLLAFKTDLDRPNRLVSVDPRTGSEKTLTYTGSISTPPVLRDSVVWWTEFQSSLYWDQRVFSRAVGYDLRTQRQKRLRDRKNALYVTPLPGGEVVTVGYDYTGRYRLDWNGGRSLPLPDTLSVHGLAYDEQTGTLALLGLSDAGMAFYRVDTLSGTLETMNRPSYSTVYNLRAGNGKLSYNSIRSGKDEIHLYDLETRQEYRLSSSRYGSVSPSAPDSSGLFYLTTYTRDGYRLARQTLRPDSLQPVPYSRLPENVVNPPRRRWAMPDMNRVPTLTPPADTSLVQKPYRKNLNLFRVHSWMPLSFNPFQIVEENKVEINAGATLMSQNLLSNTTATFSYAYSCDAGHMARTRINYEGLAPKFEVAAEYSQYNRLMYGFDEQTSMPSSLLKTHFQLEASAYLPMYLSSGSRLRVLTPRLELLYFNALLYDPVRKRTDTGLSRLVWELNYVEQSRLAHRDFLPRWGYAFKVSGVLAPFRGDFGTVYSLFGRLYLPGVAAHHSLMLRGNLQYQNQETYQFYYKDLFPRGARYTWAAARYAAFSADYQLPLCYPDWGINSLIYFNRIRLKAYFDYARYQGMVSAETGRARMHTLHSYGGEIFFDMRLVRMPVNDTSVGIYVYKPSDRRGVVGGIHLTLPL